MTSKIDFLPYFYGLPSSRRPISLEYTGILSGIMMVEYDIDEKRLTSFPKLIQFLEASSHAQFAAFEAEARENGSYSHVFQSPFVKETSLSALGICILLGKKEHAVYLLGLKTVAADAADNLALRLAVMKDDVDMVDCLLGRDEVLRQVGLQGNFLLKVAILNNNVALVNRFLQFQDIQREIAMDQNAAFRLAARAMSEGIFENILIFPEVQAQVAAKGNEALCSAAGGGFVHRVTTLLSFPMVRKKPHSFGRALEAAIKMGHEAVVRIFIEDATLGLDVSGQAAHYLSLAVEGGHCHLVEYLLTIPAFPDVVRIQNNYPFQLAVKHGHLDIVSRMLQFPEAETSLRHPQNLAISIAAEEGRLEILNRLLLVPGITYYLGATRALNQAAKNGHAQIIKRLLEFSVCSEQASRDENEALYLALRSGDEASVLLLLALPQVQNLAFLNDNEALCMASANGFVSSVETLLTLRWVWERASILRNRALYEAARNGHLSIVQMLLKNPYVRAMVAIDNNHIFHGAAVNGHDDVVRYLFSVEGVWQAIAINDNYILKEVVKKNKTTIACRLLAIPHVNQLLVSDQAHALLMAAIRNGNMDIVRVLLMFAGIQRTITHQQNQAFKVACQLGYLDIIDVFLTHPHVIRDIADNRNEALFIAAKYGHLRVVKRLLEYPAVSTAIAAGKNAAFRIALAHTRLELIPFFLQWSAVRENIRDKEYEVFELAAKAGHLNIFNQLIVHIHENSEALELIHHGLWTACKYGQDAIVSRLLTIEAVRENVTLLDNRALFWAIDYGHLSIVQQLMALDVNIDFIRQKPAYVLYFTVGSGHASVLKELLQYEAIQMILASKNNNALRLAVSYKRIDIVQTLLLFPDVQAGVSASNYLIFRDAYSYNDAPIISALLRVPGVFVYADEYEHSHGGHHVYDDVSERCRELRHRQTTFEEANPHHMFDVGRAEAIELFHVLKYYIRRPRMVSRRVMTQLMAIPEVASLLHQEITPGMPNELLQLALRQRHLNAIEQLLTFSEVRRLATENNYYNFRVGPNITHIIGNDESSMMALLPSEAAQLRLIENKYKDQMVSLGGQGAVFAQLKETLRARYLSSPAVIEIDGQPQELPFSFEAFQRLALSIADRDRALKAYFSHTDHTAHRFLSNPNFWIDPRAQYVEVNPRHPSQRSAYFENYIPMICSFWLATQDASAIGSKGFSVPARQEYFIKELAMLGRSHNWDNDRPVIVEGPLNIDQRPIYLLNANGEIVTEEYDDQELDKPSCNFGIRQRVFRSLQDHPLFDPLTLDHIDEDIRKMVTEHYKEIFRTSNRLQVIKENIEDSVINGEELSQEVIDLNISEEQVNNLVGQLRAHYGVLFDESIVFEQHVRSSFRLEHSPAHIVHFYEKCNVGFLLTQAISRDIDSVVSQVGFFRTRSPFSRRESPFVDSVVEVSEPSTFSVLMRQNSISSVSSDGLRVDFV